MQRSLAFVARSGRGAFYDSPQKHSTSGSTQGKARTAPVNDFGFRCQWRSHRFSTIRQALLKKSDSPMLSRAYCRESCPWLAHLGFAVCGRVPADGQSSDILHGALKVHWDLEQPCVPDSVGAYKLAIFSAPPLSLSRRSWPPLVRRQAPATVLGHPPH